MTIRPDELVSVIVPAYDAEATVAETLQSVLRQSHAALEVLVVDDGSRDRTAEIVTALARDDSRIVLIRQPNAGVAAARNRALAAAHGRLIAPLDADDLWHPEKIERQLDCLARGGPDAGMAYCWSADIDDRGLLIKLRLDLDRFEGDVYAALVLANFIGNSSVPLIRRELLDEIGGWDAGLRAEGAQGCEDWLLYLQLAERCRVAIVPAFLVGYRQRSSAMSRDARQMERSYARVLAAACSAHPELPSAIFRWSQAAFDVYAAALHWSSGNRARAVHLALRAAVLDPSWLCRPSTWRNFRRKADRLLGRARHRVPVASRGRPSLRPGIAFGAVPAEPDCEVSEGAWVAARRTYVASLRIAGMNREDRGRSAPLALAGGP